MCCIGVVSVKSRTSTLRQKRPLAEGGKVIPDWFITMASRHRGPPSRTGVRQLPEIFKNTSAARISRTHWKRLSRQASQLALVAGRQPSRVFGWNLASVVNLALCLCRDSTGIARRQESVLLATEQGR